MFPGPIAARRHVVFVCMLLLPPVPLFAQGSGWKIEVHGGGAIPSSLSGGTTELPAGTPLVTARRWYPSRRVSSWFFGDGAELANEVAPQFRTPFSFSDRITPLDSVLANPLAERQSGWSFGVRVSRDITPRFAAEFNLDVSSAPLEVTCAAIQGIEASAESFLQTFEGFFEPLRVNGVPVSVSSSHSILTGEGTQISVTGALNINLLTNIKIVVSEPVIQC